MSNLLSLFPEEPKAELLYELAGELIYDENSKEKLSAYPLASQARQLIEGYPQYETQKSNRSTQSVVHDSVKAAFLGHKAFTWRKLFSAWYELGLLGALEEVIDFEDPDEGTPTWLTAAGSFALSSSHRLNTVTTNLLSMSRALSDVAALFVKQTRPPQEMISEWSVVENWQESVFRAFAWHPETLKFAVCLFDNSVVVCSTSGSVQSTLKHNKQRNVTALAWRPLCSSVLAVACQSCVLLWTVEPTSLATRPATSLVQQLQHPVLSPVTSICWSAGGSLLFASSPSFPSIVVWQGHGGEPETLSRRGGGGIPLLSLSPDGSRLLATSVSNSFRVWDTCSWACERWTQLSAPVQTACWSGNGSVLLFCTRDEPMLYALRFDSTCAGPAGGDSGRGASVALPLVDFNPPDDNPQLGGRVRAIILNERSERLAVQFHDSPYIALFLIRLSPTIEVLPCGWACGRDDERPLTMQFQPNFTQGALLTVLWDSGRLSHVPFLYTRDRPAPVNDVSQLLHSIHQT